MITRRALRDALAVGAAALAITACGSVAADRSTVDTVPGVGQLPNYVAPSPMETIPSSAPTPATVAPSTASVPLVPADDTMGAVAKGNRVLMIGDSILASVSSRYTNEMCRALVPLGWQVQIEAESGRFIEFAARVMSSQWSAGWDAVMVMLGSNFNGNVTDFMTRLDTLLATVGDRPVLISTVKPTDTARAALDEAIVALVEARSNLWLLPWGEEYSDDAALFAGDGLHLSNLGRDAFTAAAAAQFGDAPTQPGACLKPVFTDDSAGPVGGQPVTSTTRPRTRTTTATTKPATTSSGTSTTSTAPSTDPPDPGGTEPTTATTAATSPPSPAPPPLASDDD